MSRRTQRSTKKRRDEESEDEEMEEVERLPYFVPQEGIDIEPLAAYVKTLLDNQVRVKIGDHPSKRDQKGFWVESRVAIGMEDIRAMIEDTRLSRRENFDGHYVHSGTFKRRLKEGRPKPAPGRAYAVPKSQSKDEDLPDPRQTRMDIEPSDPRTDPRADPRTDPRTTTQPYQRADSLPMVQQQYRAGSVSAPSPRPSSAQPIDPRRPSSTTQQYPTSASPGYNVQANLHYNIQASIPENVAFSPQPYTNVAAYDTAPPPYTDAKRAAAGSQGGSAPSQPSGGGTQGFKYATTGGTQPQNQNTRRYER